MVYKYSCLTREGDFMLNNYEINKDTIAIIPIENDISKIYEAEEEYIVNKNSNKIIEENCKFYGSSYKGRCEGTRFLIKISYYY